MLYLYLDGCLTFRGWGSGVGLNSSAHVDRIASRFLCVRSVAQMRRSAMSAVHTYKYTETMFRMHKTLEIINDFFRSLFQHPHDSYPLLTPKNISTKQPPPNTSPSSPPSSTPPPSEPSAPAPPPSNGSPPAPPPLPSCYRPSSWNRHVPCSPMPTFDRCFGWRLMTWR